MGLMWFVLGLIVGLSVQGGLELRRRFELDWRAWGGLVLGELLLLFCVAWIAASASVVHAQGERGRRSSLERWEKLSREEQAELRARFQRFRDLDEEEKQVLRRRARNLRAHRERAGSELELVDPKRFLAAAS